MICQSPTIFACLECQPGYILYQGQCILEAPFFCEGECTASLPEKGVEVSIPADSLTDSQEITMGLVDLENLQGIEADAAIYLGPEGLQFATPVTVCIFTPPKQLGEVYTFQSTSDNGASWEPLMNVVYNEDTSTLCGETMHFSIFASASPALTRCSNSEFETQAPTDTLDRSCSPCTECPDGVQVACTRIKDAECAAKAETAFSFGPTFILVLVVFVLLIFVCVYMFRKKGAKKDDGLDGFYEDTEAGTEMVGRQRGDTTDPIKQMRQFSESNALARSGNDLNTSQSTSMATPSKTIAASPVNVNSSPVPPSTPAPPLEEQPSATSAASALEEGRSAAQPASTASLTAPVQSPKQPSEIIPVPELDADQLEKENQLFDAL